MRLIDADALLFRLTQVCGCATCDSYNGLKCRACPWDDILTEVDDWADSNQVDRAE